MRLSSADDAKLGWVFTSEDDEQDEGQGFAYTVPLQSDSDDWRRYTYKFPGVREGNYIEFHASREGNFLVVKADDTRVRFSTLEDFRPPFPVTPEMSPSPYRPLPYLGKYTDLTAGFKLFLAIYPVDVAELDGLYAKGVVLVGMTPKFQPH